jgi:hypothetical protein
MLKRNEFRLVRAKDGSLNVLVLLRNVSIRGPFKDGTYLLANRKFRARRNIKLKHDMWKKPQITIRVDWQPSWTEWKAAVRHKQLELARAHSPMLK